MRILRRRREHIALETLSEHLDGRLRGSERQRVERHLEACSLCSEELRSLEATVGLLRRVPMESPRRVFTLGEAPSSASSRQRLRVPAWAYGAVASVAVMLFVALLSADLTGSLAGEASTPETEQAGLEAASVPEEEALASPAPEESQDIAVSAAPGEPQEGEGAATAAEAAVEDDSGVEEALPMSTSAPQIAAAAAPTEETEAQAAVPPPGVAEREVSKDEVVTRDDTTQTPVPVAANPPAPLPDAPREETIPEAPADARDGPEAPAPEARAGGTSAVWHVLEGVLGGVALSLTAGVVWRLWRTRRRPTP